jgi:hypothetical protein
MMVGGKENQHPKIRKKVKTDSRQELKMGIE